MKKVAASAIFVSVLSGAVIADSAVESAPRLDLAMNDVIAKQWAPDVKPRISSDTADRVQADAFTKNMALVSAQLEKRLEEKAKRDLINAM